MVDNVIHNKKFNHVEAYFESYAWKSLFALKSYVINIWPNGASLLTFNIMDLFIFIGPYLHFMTSANMFYSILAKKGQTKENVP